MKKPPKAECKVMIKHYFYLLNLVVFSLLLMPSLTDYITFWRVDNLLNLQIQWALLAVLLILINLFYIKTLRLTFSLLYLTVIAINFMPLYWPNSEPFSRPEEAQTFTVAQLNMSYDNPDLTLLLPILSDKNFDLLVIQEASDNEHNKIEKLATFYPYSFGLSPTDATPSGMAIFSRWLITESHIHDLGYKSGQILEVILQVPGSLAPIQVYAIHPNSPRTKILWQGRNQTLAMVAERAVSSPFSNKMIIGDFNSSPWSHSFKHLQTTSQLKNSANGFGYIPSWSYSSKPLFSILSSAYIDHSLVSASFSVLNKYSQSVQGSDHLLMVTELAI